MFRFVLMFLHSVGLSKQCSKISLFVSRDLKGLFSGKQCPAGWFCFISFSQSILLSVSFKWCISIDHQIWKHAGGHQTAGCLNVSHKSFESLFLDIWAYISSWYEQCLASLKLLIDTHQTQTLLSMKRLLKRSHDNLIYTLLNLGLWGAIQVEISYWTNL